MNDLAHLYLARPEPLSRMGNLLGDHRRGVDCSGLPQAVLRGLANHQAVDAFTDAHPLVQQARTWFSPARRRFAGVALDVLFDHFLVRHWSRFADQPLDPWVDAIYRDLEGVKAVMPASMRGVLDRRMEHDWLRRYDSLDTVARVLDGLADRIRFRNGFAGMIREIEPLENQLEKQFLDFFPRLVGHVDGQALEYPDSGQIGP